MSKSDFIDIFANNLMRIMEKKHMSQRELAIKARISKGNISKYLMKQRMPSLKAFMNICYALGCDPEDLFVPHDKIS